MNEAEDQIGQAEPQERQRYPHYRASGVEWLGEVPTHWNVAPVHARYEVALGKMLDATRVTGQASGRYLRNVDVQWDAVNVEDLPEMDFAPSERDRYLVQPGDLLVCEGGEVGRTAQWKGELDECFYQKAIHRLRPRSEAELPRFFFFLMYTLAKRGVFTAGGNPNTIDHLTAVQLRHHRAPFPPPTEQRCIAAFLDRETAKIDTLVARKERLIALLQEKRTALITRAVTRGLDPKVPMNDSGVEWLDEVPAHWEVKRLKWAVTFQRGHDLPDQERQDGHVPVVSSSGVSATHSRPAARAPGIVTGRYGTIGHFYLVTEDYWPLNTTLYSIDLRDNSPRFLTHMLSSLSSLFVANAQKSAVPGVDRNDVHPIETAIPPPPEQQNIADFLDRETRKVDALVEKVNEAIDRLNELRTALISAVVTGKIDVREAASRHDTEL